MSVLLFKILIAFCVGGAFISLLTYLSEKFGSKIGGILASFPSTLLISLFFIGIFSGVDAAQTASLSTLMGVSVFGVFCIGFTRTIRLGFYPAMVAALFCWAVFSYAIYALHIQNFWLALGLFFIIAVGAYYILQRSKLEEGQSKLSFLKGPKVYLTRFIIGGGVVALVTYLNETAGAYMGGIFSAFPALAISALVILKQSMSLNFAANFVKSQFTGAAINCSLYITAVYFFYPMFGVVIGTLVASIFPVISTILLLKFYRR